MASMKAYAKGVPTLKVGERGQRTVQDLVTPLAIRGMHQSAVRYCFCCTGPSCNPIRSVLGSTES